MRAMCASSARPAGVVLWFAWRFSTIRPPENSERLYQQSWAKNRRARLKKHYENSNNSWKLERSPRRLKKGNSLTRSNRSKRRLKTHFRQATLLRGQVRPDQSADLSPGERLPLERPSVVRNKIGG